MAKRPASERFWKYVDKASDPRGCWLWMGARLHFGHGAFRGENSVMTRAHRFSWLLHRGVIPQGLEVLHTCDNPPCVNPLHLFLGTKQLNVIDRDSKGRTARGDANGARRHPERLARGEDQASARLSDEAVREIRRLRMQGLGTKDLAIRFSVHRTTIQRAVSKRNWKHVQD